MNQGSRICGAKCVLKYIFREKSLPSKATVVPIAFEFVGNATQQFTTGFGMPESHFHLTKSIYFQQYGDHFKAEYHSMVMQNLAEI